jgi:cysteine desulfurase/selenocysteine lyase
MTPEEFRANIPAAREAAYLNNAAITPMSLPVRSAIERTLDRMQGIMGEDMNDFFGRPQRIRRMLAGMLNASEEEVGLVTCTSAGLSMLANSLPLEAGDEVLIPRGEFPASAYAWLNAASRRGLKVRYVPSDVGVLPTDRLLEAIGSSTRVVSCSLVSFSSGFRCDAERIGLECRRRGIFFILDGTQAIGALPTDVKAIGCTAIAGSGHKWLHCLPSTGYMHVDQELLQRLEPPNAHWLRYLKSDNFQGLTDYDYRALADARKFETATAPFIEMAAMEAGVSMLLDVGVKEVRNNALALLDRLSGFLEERGLEIVAPLDAVHRSTILCFRHPDAGGLHGYLLKKRIITSLREGAIRVSPGGYNNAEDIERLMAAVSEYPGS